MLSYPENTIWYIEARPWNGVKNQEPGFAQADPVSRGSGCAVTMTKVTPSGERRPQTYILTCAHVVRDKFDCLLEDIICYPPGYGFIRTTQNSRRCGTFPNAEAYPATVSSYSPCQGTLGPRDKKLKDAITSDWVLLEVDEPNFLHRPAIRVLNPERSYNGLVLSTIGFPFGAGTLAEKELAEKNGKGNEYTFWKNGKVVIPTRARNFRFTGYCEPGMLDYEGPEETRPGMSGGGVFDDDGVFIGIHRSATDATMKKGAISCEAIALHLYETHQLEFFSVRKEIPSSLNHRNSFEKSRSRIQGNAVERQELKLQRLIEDGASKSEINEAGKELHRIRRQSQYSVELHKAMMVSGRYILAQKLGSGGFGEVWRAWDRELNQFVALKFLHRHLGKDNSTSDRFLRGAKQLQRLTHPNIVRILHEPVLFRDYLYYAMQFIENGNFNDAIINKAITLDNSMQLLAQIGLAIQHLHDNEMIHRDVKPQNILIDGHGLGILGDFDLVRAQDTFGFTQTSSFGTHLFSAPEIMDSTKQGDHRSDIFSLGMTTIFAIFGQDLPFSIIRDTPAFIETLDVSDDVKGVLERSVQFDPGIRFASISEYISELTKAWQANRNQKTVKSSKTLSRFSKQALIDIIGEHELREHAYDEIIESIRHADSVLLGHPPENMGGFSCFTQCRSAMVCGGDHLDFIELKDGRIAIIIVDVVGLCFPAALFKWVFAMIAKITCSKNCDATSIMYEINETFTNLNTDRFITAILLVLDLINNEVEIVIAGHIPPMIRTLDGAAIDLGEEISGPPLGIMSDIQFDSVKYTFQEKELMLLFTDGVFEAPDANGVQFGIHRLKDLLAGSTTGPIAFGTRLVKELDDHISGMPQEDDIAIICLGLNSTS
jgi:serine/threonine protein kinase